MFIFYDSVYFTMFVAPVNRLVLVEWRLRNARYNN